MTRIKKIFVFYLLSGAYLLPQHSIAQVDKKNVIELPLTGAAFSIADEAYKAYNNGDYETAIFKVREAIRQRPDVIRLKGLLIASLESLGQTEQALIEAQGLIDAGTASPEINGQAHRLRVELARKPAEAAYRALERGDLDEAVAESKEAVRLAPDATAHRMLHIYTLLRKEDYQAASDATSAALILDSEDINSLIMRAYSLQRMGKIAQANEDFDLALQQDWLSDEDILAIRLIAIDAAIAANDPSRAILLIKKMDKSDKNVKARFERIEKASASKALNTGDNTFPMPLLDCRVTPYGRVCSVMPGFSSNLTQSQDAGYDTAAKAYTAYAARNFELAEASARKAVDLSPENASYKKLLANTLSAQKIRSASSGQSTQLAIQIDPAYAEAVIIGNLMVEKRENDARSAFDTAFKSGKLVSLPPLSLAYLASRVGNKAVAYERFKQVHNQGQLQGLQLVDAAYAAKRVYDNELAIKLLKEAIDQVGGSIEPQQLFNLRREVATLARTWGTYNSLSHGSVSTLPGDTSYASTTQWGTEVYWRPPNIGYRDGALFEIFARQFTTLYDENSGPTGFSTTQGSIGARWKPLKNYNLILEAARLFKIGDNSRQDTMLRVAFSEGRGTDLRVDVPSWNMWQVYGELGHYLDVKQTFLSFEGRVGRSYRVDEISDRLVVTPFFSVGGNYDNLLENMWAIGTGPGVNFRWWFREDKYTAPMSYVDANIQYKFKLHGDDRAKGIFASLTVAY